MTGPAVRGPIVIDTDVFGADLVPGSRLAELYEPIIVGRPAIISFQPAAELHFGALLRGWGPARMLKLQARLEVAEIVHTGPELVLAYARLRADCRRIGHASQILDTTRGTRAPGRRMASGTAISSRRSPATSSTRRKGSTCHEMPPTSDRPQRRS